MASNAILLAGEYTKVQSLSLAAGQTPKPGQVLMMNTAGALTVNTVLTGPIVPYLVLEDALQGKTVADAYTAATVVDCAIPMSGAIVQVLVVAGENIAIGDRMGSTAAGKFAELDSTTTHPLCIALEAQDLSGSGAVDTLTKARWI